MNRNRFVRATLVLLALAIPACGPKTLHLTAAPEVPAAESTVKVSSTDNGNTKLELVVHHLAAPDRVTPGAKVFIVWARDTQSRSLSQNIGALKVDSDLNGSLTAVTPLRNFELFITAEPTQAATEPTGRRVLYTNVSMK